MSCGLARRACRSSLRVACRRSPSSAPRVARVSARNSLAPRVEARVLARAPSLAVLARSQRAPPMRSTAVANDSLNMVSPGAYAHLVRQLVEDQARQLALGIADEGVEQRVAAEPSRASPAWSTPAPGRRRPPAPARAARSASASASACGRSSRGSRRSRRPGSTRSSSVSESSGAATTFQTAALRLQVGVAAVARLSGSSSSLHREVADALRERQPRLAARRRAPGRPATRPPAAPRASGRGGRWPTARSSPASAAARRAGSAAAGQQRASGQRQADAAMRRLIGAPRALPATGSTSTRQS